MDMAERCQRSLPTEDIPYNIYERMESLFGDRRNVDVGGLLFDWLDDDVTPLEEGSNANMEHSIGEPQTPPPQSLSTAAASSDTSTDTQLGGIKRKTRERTNSNSLKDIAESTRKLASFADNSEDRRDAREENRFR
ncbi:hypothetical protein L7F22_045846 [Adiantum nelumboides]|nr:hypothetical protein [Adiantum nelumboides]